MALALALAGAACDRKPEGTLEVAVLGPPPKLVDPATGPLSPGEAVVLQNVAQGLVRFDARGQIEPGLAERWNVSDDGLSYIFRLASANWPNGRRITAQQVARLLRRQIASSSNNALRDSLGAISEIVAMTDRVLEIRLQAPRPNLLNILAQPELGLVFENQGSGPFTIRESQQDALILSRLVTTLDEGEEERTEQLMLRGAEPAAAIRDFAAGELDLVLGGTFAELPFAQRVQLPRGSIVFDPVAGLFGLVPARGSDVAEDVELRQLLSQAIDRAAFVAALDVTGLVGRATLLEPGLDGVPDPVVPAWSSVPLAERRPELIAAADRLFEGEERPTIRLALADGPGADLLLNRLRQDWGPLGLRVERADRPAAADFALIDAVAPSLSPAWFLRQFRCEFRSVCSEEADDLLEAARSAPVPAQRAALLAEAARLMDEAQLFIPIAAPVRWALVSDRVAGFAGNRFGRHTLVGIEEKLAREGAQ